MAVDQGSTPGPRGRGTRSVLRDELRSALEISALVGFAIVQPVLGPFGESPESFAAVGASPGQIVAFALIVALAPVLVLSGLGTTTRLVGARTRHVVQTILVASLAALTGAAMARHLGAGPWVRASAGILLMGAVALGYWRWEPARLFLRYASPVPVLLVVVFLFASPVAPLVRPAAVEIEAVEAGDHPPVVFVLLDELPTLSLVDGAGGIDADLVPNIARLANTSTWYRDHTSMSPSTMTSIPALLTGQLPSTHEGAAAPTFADHPDNLLTLLARTHDVHGVEWATQLCPPSVCSERHVDLEREAASILGRRLTDPADPFEVLVDEARSLWWSQVWPTAADHTTNFVLAGMGDADDGARGSLEFLGGIGAGTGGRPTVDYLHAALPHTPWLTVPSGAAYNGPGIAFGAELLGFLPGGDVGEQAAAAARTRHLLQVQWTDRLLGEIIDRLKKIDRWDDAVVVVTADHGVAFRAGANLRDLVPETQVDVGWTPLFVKAPGQTDGEVVDDDVTALDVLPTVADLTGVEVGWEVDGRSLIDGPPPDGRPKPMTTGDPTRFDIRLTGDLVGLDADGLGAIRTAPSTGDPADQLRVWRHGRHGALLGRPVDDIGICNDPGPPADVELPDTWHDYAAGRLAPEGPLPLWVEGTLGVDDQRDVAAAVDGTIVAWGTSHPDHFSQTGNRFGLLLTEPLLDDPRGPPTFFEIVDVPECGLRALAG